jgi:uncharacterized membrane protein
MTGSVAALRAGVAALIAQLALQLAWHAWLAPQSRAALALAVLPLLPPLWICRFNLRRGVLVGGIVSLFYFCHGVAELGSAAGMHLAATAEVLLCLVVIVASYQDARGYGRRAG